MGVRAGKSILAALILAVLGMMATATPAAATNYNDYNHHSSYNNYNNYNDYNSGCYTRAYDFPNGHTFLAKKYEGAHNLTGSLNDDVESVYIPHGCQVSLAEHWDGAGWCRTYNGPGTFNLPDDELSWINVGGGCPSAPAPAPAPAPSPSSCSVELFDFPKAGTYLSTLGTGTYNLDGNLHWLNDDIESIRIPAGCTVAVAEHYHGGGWCKVNTGPGVFEVHDDQVSWIGVGQNSCTSKPTPPAPTATAQPTSTPVPPTATPVPVAPKDPILPPEGPECPAGSYLWENGIDITKLSGDAGIPEAMLRLKASGTTSFVLPNLPASLGTPGVTIDVSDVVSWDSYEARASTKAQPNEQWFIAFLNNGSVVYSTEYTADLADGIVGDNWYGPLGDVTVLPDGADEVRIVHYNDTTWGNGPTGSANSVVPVSVCIKITEPDPDPGSIGDRVWQDNNADGVQDAGEPGIAGVTVLLLDAAGNVIDRATTGADGGYNFGDLDAGQYTVSIDASTLPAGLQQTYDLDGTLDGSSVEDLDQGENNDTHDFGYVPLGSIGDTVWFDANANGIIDGGERGIGGVTVQLSNGDTTVTAIDGTYLFEGLVAGDYTVTVIDGVPAGATQTFDNEGPLDETSSLTLGAGEDNLDQDFGYRLVGNLGDTVWFDDDGDGTVNNGEAGIPGVDLELVQGGVVIGTATTDDAGMYMFSNLPEGTYTVNVVTSTLPAGVEQTFDNSGVSTDSSSTWTLLAGTSNLDQDFGYRLLGTIGDTVWFDDDLSGTQNNGEAGIPGVDIQLVDGGRVVGAATTDADGMYLFENLSPGSYAVRIVTSTLPDGVRQTYDASGALDDVSRTTIDAGGEDLDQDFGYVLLGEIGDTVWFDNDADGSVNNGESGISGVDVELIDDATGFVVRTATTDLNGNYLFSDLIPGDYTVNVIPSTLPAGVVQTFDNDGGLDDTSSTTLAPGGSDLAQDFGYRLLGAIGDTVWFDDDASGTINNGETGIADVEVELVDGSGAVLGTDTTDAAGNYLFTDLPAGDYTVNVVTSTLPAGVEQTFDDDGGLDDTSTTAITAGGSDLDQDFGYRLLGTIGDTVWFDDDASGTINNGETGIDGVRVELVENGAVVATDITDGSGEYLFTDLPAGDYTVNVVASTLPAGVEQTFDNDGGLDDTSSTTLAAGADDLDQDFGYRLLSEIGDTVWYDNDASGTINNGEAGIPSVDVELVDGSGAVVATDTTDGNGEYLFTGLAAGDYTVNVVTSTLPAGVEQTFDNDGGLDDTSSTTIGAGDSDLDQDFGYRLLGAIGDTVWFDDDASGTINNGEIGIGDVEVELLDGSGAVVGTDTTDANGTYLFTDLSAGDYTVNIVTSTLPADVVQTFDDDGGLDDTSSTSIGAGDSDLDQDFGYRLLGTIGDTVWFDDDASGTINNGETGIEGVRVELVEGGVIVDAADTNASGEYLFTDLPAGDYTVNVVTATLPAGVEQTFDNDGGLDDTSSTTLAGGADDLDQDFGYRLLGTIGDTVWFDDDSSGTQNGAEAGIEGVDLELVEGGAVVATDTTDANGEYLFTGLPAGDYTVNVVTSTLPADVQQTFDNDGGLDDTSSTTLPAGGEDLDQDFGYVVPLGEIGDLVWLDNDADATFNAGDDPIPNVTVELVQGGAVIATDDTDASGNYLFTDLPAGDYTVQVVESTLPDNIVQTYDLTAPLDSTSEEMLTAGESNLTHDFGYTPILGTIGDFVFFDRDANGEFNQRPGVEDEPIEDVTINLYGDGALVATDVTDASGEYLFENLPLGVDYRVELDYTTLPVLAAPQIWAQSFGLGFVYDPAMPPVTDVNESFTTLPVASLADPTVDLRHDFGYTKFADSIEIGGGDGPVVEPTPAPTIRDLRALYTGLRFRWAD